LDGFHWIGIVWFMGELNMDIVRWKYSLDVGCPCHEKIVKRAHPCFLIFIISNKLKIIGLLYYYLVIMMVRFILVSANMVIGEHCVCQLG
jgi:hypothetical protein